MEKIINNVLWGIKLLLLVISFIITFYIVMYMYKRLGKSYLGTIDIFLPYLLLLIVYIINLTFNQKVVRYNTFYNITSIFVLITIIFCGYRALSDDFMLNNIKLGYHINFNYYSDMLVPIKSLLYLLFASNIFLMISKKNK